MQGPADLRTYQIKSNCLNLDGGCFFLMVCVEDKLTWRYIYFGVWNVVVYTFCIWCLGDLLLVISCGFCKLSIQSLHTCTIKFLLAADKQCVALNCFVSPFTSSIQLLSSCSFRLLCCGIETNHCACHAMLYMFLSWRWIYGVLIIWRNWQLVQFISVCLFNGIEGGD